MIAVLEVTLRISENNTGLGSVPDDKYRHLLWTSLPAVIVSFVAVFFSSIDFNTRALSPYAQMIKGGSFKTSVNANLLDKTTPVVLFEAAVTRNIGVIGTTTAFLIASLLSIFTASVFSTVDVPVVDTVQLLSQDFFASSQFLPANESARGNFNTGQNSTVVPSLILNANMSFPAFTYQDMAFPSLSVAGLQDGLDVSGDIKFTTTIPATRARMDCKLIPDNLINVNLTLEASIDFGGAVNPLEISIIDDPANASITISTARGANGVSPKSPIKTFIDSNAFFGAADYVPYKNASSNTNQTAHYVYVWGRLSNADTNSTTLDSVSALTCNEVLRDVDVEVTFLGSSLLIDETQPPKPIESTDRPSSVAMEEAWNYNNMVNVSTPHLLDQFFTSLVQSQFAIPLEDLGLDDIVTRGAVADAIVAQHGIIRAQVTSTNLRRPTTNSTAEEDVSPEDVSGGSLGDATQFAYAARLESTGVGARRRVVQDLVTTRILQSLLAAMVLFTIIGWIAFPKPNILPRPPTSIASVAALLVDGNVFGFLGRGAEWQTADEVQAVFKDGLHVTAGFKLGWDKLRKRRREETLATWGMNGSVQKEKVFSISAMRTGGWGGGENVGLGLQARVGYGHRRFVRDWGWRQ
ncbi:hypothetical protein UCRPA7_665 [Phaeoacremonium minimum UCRPA7]|uniref:Uncharacterized protein n=1 Tax=Phaeoacremonium minimum (strain UCR-PA7) TaxID=1286976 RepID=R8BWY9_PHAM7|nr:hypothetical protein UCRPA7_665 [Phaeoacremonium minimum UCRPA7]EOO03891.1 hypothetical protein UCRPA7_665 [Phaeoacremonium minimum UCRPA7]